MKTWMDTRVLSILFALGVAGIVGCGHQGVTQGNRAIETQPSSDIARSHENQMTLNKDGERNRSCTYYHEQANGSRWKTKWC